MLLHRRPHAHHLERVRCPSSRGWAIAACRPPGVTLAVCAARAARLGRSTRAGVFSGRFAFRRQLGLTELAASALFRVARHARAAAGYDHLWGRRVRDTFGKWSRSQVGRRSWTFVQVFRAGRDPTTSAKTKVANGRENTSGEKLVGGVCEELFRR